MKRAMILLRKRGSPPLRDEIITKSREMRSLQRVVKELEKKNYKYLLDKENLKKENQQLKEELKRLKNS